VDHSESAPAQHLPHLVLVDPLHLARHVRHRQQHPPRGICGGPGPWELPCWQGPGAQQAVEGAAVPAVADSCGGGGGGGARRGVKMPPLGPRFRTQNGGQVSGLQLLSSEASPALHMRTGIMCYMTLLKCGTVKLEANQKNKCPRLPAAFEISRIWMKSRNQT